MNRLFTLIIAVFLTANVWAQSPEQISYQSVIRDNGGALLQNQSIGLRISVLQGVASGSAVYTETHAKSTNSSGLVSLAIGTGTSLDDFSSIDWENGPYFIKTETDPNGGTNYTIVGTSQLLSVPYALHAKTAANGLSTVQADAITANTAKTGITIEQADIITNISGINTGDQDGSETIVTAGTNVTVTGLGTAGSPYVVNTTSSAGALYLGQEKDGGIIYYLYTGSDGNQHGLIVSKTESTARWQPTGTSTNANRTEDGVYNTAQMTSSAAATYVAGLGIGWYLPSIDELALLYYNRYHANKSLRDGGHILLSKTANYWSSTEHSTDRAYDIKFVSGQAYSGYKNNSYSVRAVRAF